MVASCSVGVVGGFVWVEVDGFGVQFNGTGEIAAFEFVVSLTLDLISLGSHLIGDRFRTVFFFHGQGGLSVPGGCDLNSVLRLKTRVIL